MSNFKPCWDILPAARRRLWPQLQKAADLGFVLYDGTAIALRLGHRTSVDFDFFSEKSLDRDAIKGAFPFMAHATSLLDKGDTWSVLVPCSDSKGWRPHIILWKHRFWSSRPTWYF